MIGVEYGEVFHLVHDFELKLWGDGLIALTGDIGHWECFPESRIAGFRSVDEGRAQAIECPPRAPLGI
jgi:hypothetical protein